MKFRFFLLMGFLFYSSNSFSQTFSWKNADKTKGSVSFDDINVNFLIIKFDTSYVGYDYASKVYKKNVDEYQLQLEKILASSGINYTLISRNELKDSIYLDVQKYPVVIDHEAVVASGENEGCFLILLIRDRRTKVRVGVRFPHRSTKYTSPYKTFIRKVKKGKSMRMKIY